ncbi:MAG: chromate efflux transporter [Deltaproteobacteria bacterium]|nr:chromate efflux transporter [Deltaproteobacteria bacterium]
MMNKSFQKTPSMWSLFLSFLRLGLTAFGGPAMVAYIKELSVKQNSWLDEQSFQEGVVICQSIPGATAMQTAAYVGLRARGLKGALTTYIGFGLPAFIFMLILSFLYVRYSTLNQVSALFRGLAVIVVAIVANATYSFGKGSVKDYKELLIALLAAILFWLGLSPFLVIIGAALAGILLFSADKIVSSFVPNQKNGNTAFYKHISLLFLLLITALIGIYYTNTKLFNLAALMLKIDTFAFGGGFASVPLMLHEVVSVKRWMDYKTFIDGIALGQITPGPIVITATFVGFIVYGIIGALVATVAVFTPSFLILVLVTPVFDRLKSSVLISKATKGILASFVGLLFFVTIKFALAVPWDVAKVVFGIAALAALLKKVNILYVVLIGAVVSIFLF